MLKVGVYLAAFVSGFFVMGIELLGGRLLSPYFGSSIFVWGGIITVFMMSLSAGYLAGGYLSRRDPSPKIFAVLLLLAAVLALPIVAVGEAMLEALSYLVADPRAGSLLTSLAMFAGPSFVAGMISPYAVRLLVSNVQSAGKSAGMLYFVSTFGSASGTLLTSFLFVLYWEVNTIIFGLIVAMAICGAALWWMEPKVSRA
jgi:MFS family permease